MRALPRFRLPNVYLSDTYLHLHCAQLIREGGYKLPARLPRVLLGHEFTYPFLYHYLLALFPLRQRLWLERHTGAIFDTASLAVIYAFLEWLAGRGGAVLDSRAPLLVAALFAISPALLRIGSGPRAYNGSPRTVGQFLYLLHILAAYSSLTTHSPAAAALSALAGGAVVLTAKFATQVLIFFGAFFAAFVSVWYLALLAGAFAVALVLGGRRAWRVLVGQYRFSDFYFRHLQAIFLHHSARSLKEYGISLLTHVRDVLTRGAVRPALAWYFSEPHPLHLLITVYTPFLVLPQLAADYPAMSAADRFLFVWILAALVWFAATKSKPLMFLGEGERYLEYATFPSLALAVGVLAESHIGLIYGFLAYSAAAMVFYLTSYQSRFAGAHADFPETERAFETLNRLPRGVIMPIGSLHWQALHRTSFPVLTTGGNVDLSLLPLEEFMLVYGRNPYPSTEFARILERYDVKYIVSDRVHVRHYVENILRAPELFHERVKTLFDSPALVIYQVVRPG